MRISSRRSRRFFKVLGYFLDSFRAGGGLQRCSLRRPVSLLSSDTVKQACEKRKQMHLHFPLRHRACRSSAGLLKFARLSGKQIVVVTRTMCRVGGAVLASLYLWKIAGAPKTTTPTLLPLCRRNRRTCSSHWLAICSSVLRQPLQVRSCWNSAVRREVL